MGTFQEEDGKLLPDREITREQPTVLARVFALEDGKSAVLNGFADGDQVMCNLVGMYIDAPQTVTQAAQGNLVVRASGANFAGHDGKR